MSEKLCLLSFPFCLLKRFRTSFLSCLSKLPRMSFCQIRPACYFFHIVIFSVDCYGNMFCHHFCRHKLFRFSKLKVLRSVVMYSRNSSFRRFQEYHFVKLTISCQSFVLKISITVQFFICYVFVAELLQISI